ncbi:MAG: phytoene desaturase family protein [Alphaproteobacteria bacterium]
MSRSVVIIGAGPGGLAAAMLLRSAGCEVTVLERLGRVGGRCSTIHAEGFTFDTGPTLFLYPAVLESIFAQCGYNLYDEVNLTRLDPLYDMVFEGGGRLRARGDLAAMTAELGSLSPEDGAALPRYMAENRKKLDSFRPILENPFGSLLDYLRPEVLRSLPLLRPHLSMDADLRRYFRDERTRLAFSFQSKYLGMSPFTCPSLFTILAFMEYEHGVFHPAGGCGAVIVRMSEIAAEMGVRIHLGEPAEEMLFEGRRAVGVRTRQGTYRADAVVVNADFAQAMTRLVPDRLRRRWKDRAIARKTFSCSTFMMYLGIEGRYDDLAHHTIYLSEDFETYLDDIQKRKILPEQPSFYIQNAGVTDPTLAPEGMSTIYVLAPVAHVNSGVNWREETPAFRDLLYRRLEQAGLPGLRSRVRYEKILTPQGWMDDLNIYRGATFNLAHSFGQMLWFRPHNRFEDLDGVYIVGGGTHPGSGLPVIFESARISTRLMARDLGFEMRETAQTRTGARPVPALQLEKAS